MDDIKEEIEKVSKEQKDEIWKDLDFILTRKGPFANSQFDPSGKLFDITPKEFLHQYCKILILGAGSLGCNILKNVSLSGFKDIDILDYDTIERPVMFFQKSDIGKSKAKTIADYISNRVLDVKITGHYGRVEEIIGKVKGYKGQARVIIPRVTSCYEYTQQLLPKKENIFLTSMNYSCLTTDLLEEALHKWYIEKGRKERRIWDR